MKKIFFGWWVVVAAAVGLAFSPGPVVFYSLGVFMQPLMQEFGWVKADVTFAATILTIAIILTTPLVGLIVDKTGPRRVLLFSITALALGLGSIYFVNSLSQFYIAYGFIGIGGAGANSMAYMKLLSTWFDRHRGLSIGIASAGMGFGFTIVPALTQTAIEHFGYRGAYVTLALVVFISSVPLIALIVRDSPKSLGLRPDGDTEIKVSTATAIPADESGFTLREAVGRRHFWILLLVFFTIGGALYALVIHMVSIVTEITDSTSTAIQTATFLGLAMMVGRVVSGYLFDRFFAPKVIGIIFFLAAFGVGLFLMEIPHIWIYLSAMLIGFCSGTEGDALAYLVSRYFGIFAFGKIYGYVFSAVMLGISFFPYLIALDYDNTGNYERGLIVCMTAFVTGGILLFFIGPYPKLPQRG